jgi:hypothetical protein
MSPVETVADQRDYLRQGGYKKKFRKTGKKRVIWSIKKAK